MIFSLIRQNFINPYVLGLFEELHCQWPQQFHSILQGLCSLLNLLSPFLQGILDRDGQRIDVDREFSLMFVTMDENNNWYIDENINYLTEDPGPLNELKASFDFWESNLKAAINGYVFGNMPPPTMYTGEKVVWYLLQVGGMTEMHTVHFHGQSILYVSIKITIGGFCLFPGAHVVHTELILVSLYDGQWVGAEETESHVTIECTKRVSMR